MSDNKSISSKNTKDISIDHDYLDLFYRYVWSLLYKRPYNPSKLELLIKTSISDITDIWVSYNTLRSSIKGFNFNNLRYTYAYLTGFHLPNLARFNLVYQRLKQRVDFKSFLSSFSNINITDLGCGTGAMSQALVVSLLHDYSNLLDSYSQDPKDQLLKPNLNFNINLLDRSSYFLQSCKKILSLYLDTIKSSDYPFDINHKIYTLRSSVETLDISRFTSHISKDSNTLNIVIISYLYNELSSKSQSVSMLTRLISSLTRSSNSLVFLFDPANQTPSKNLTRFCFDLIEKDTNLVCIYPCQPACTQCPMIDKKDWCYSQAHFSKDPLTKLVDKAIKTNRSQLSTTGFILSSKDSGLVKNNFLSSMLTVVGQPTIKADKTQNHIQYLLCDGSRLTKSLSVKKEDVTLSRGEIYLKETLGQKQKPNKQINNKKKPITAKTHNRTK